MCKLNQQELLSGQGDCQVSWCKGCEKYSLCYKQVCFSFDQKEIREFLSFLINLTDQNFQYFLQNHERQVLIKNHLSNAGFFLSEKEVMEIVDLISQSIILLEAHELISV